MPARNWFNASPTGELAPGPVNWGPLIGACMHIGPYEPSCTVVSVAGGAGFAHRKSPTGGEP